MKKALIAAVAALSATAWAAAPAYAQRNDDRGRHERNNDNGDRDRGGRGQRDQHRSDDGDRGRSDWRGNGDSAQNQAPPQAAPRQRAPDNPALLGGDERSGDRRGQWQGDRGPRGDGARPTEPRANEWANRQRDAGQRDAQRDAQRDGRRGEWNSERAPRNPPPVVADNRQRDHRGEWNGDARRDGDRSDWNGRRDGRGDPNRGDGRDWTREGRDGRGDRDWNNNDRNRDWGRDWGHEDRGRDRDNAREHQRRRDFAYNDWGRDGRRDDNRYRPYRHTHRDFDRPRYSDWRHVRHGHYFDRGYTFIVHNYFGWNYSWWGYEGWRRPYRPWRVGSYLPDYIWWEPVPYDLYYRLPPAPYGCRYVMVDRDILLVAVATGIILDALMYY